MTTARFRGKAADLKYQSGKENSLNAYIEEIRDDFTLGTNAAREVRRQHEPTDAIERNRARQAQKRAGVPTERRNEALRAYTVNILVTWVELFTKRNEPSTAHP